jgi:hypothetical protein
MATKLSKEEVGEVKKQVLAAIAAEVGKSGGGHDKGSGTHEKGHSKGGDHNKYTKDDKYLKK